jgi:hypothetical protein
VELDLNFASAYLVLGIAFGNTGALCTPRSSGVSHENVVGFELRDYRSQRLTRQSGIGLFGVKLT